MPELSLTLGNVGSTFLFHLSLGLDPEQLVGIEQGTLSRNVTSNMPQPNVSGAAVQMSFGLFLPFLTYGTSAYGRCCRRSIFQMRSNWLLHRRLISRRQQCFFHTTQSTCALMEMHIG